MRSAHDTTKKMPPLPASGHSSDILPSEESEPASRISEVKFSVPQRIGSISNVTSSKRISGKFRVDAPGRKKRPSDPAAVAQVVDSQSFRHVLRALDKELADDDEDLKSEPQRRSSGLKPFWNISERSVSQLEVQPSRSQVSEPDRPPSGDLHLPMQRKTSKRKQKSSAKGQKKDHDKKRDSQLAEPPLPTYRHQEPASDDELIYDEFIDSLKYTSSITAGTSTKTGTTIETSIATMTTQFSDVSSLGFSFSHMSAMDATVQEQSEVQEHIDGYDSNLLFEKSSSETELSHINSEESDEPTESSISGLDTTVIPFSLLWTYGMNTKVPFMNLTEKNKPHIFFTASHEGVLYDYVKKEMTLLQGHQNAITSASMDIKGKYLVTADSGPENSIIVWLMSKCKPVCTIFNANPGSGTAILTMSPNGRYIVSVTSDMPAIIKLWVWSTGSDQPVDTYVTDPTYGKPIGVVFNLTVQERFMVTFKRQIVFMKYLIVEKRFIEPRIPEIRNKSKLGKITDSCYLLENHDCFASTTDGYIMVLGNTYYKTEFNINEEYDARKIFITAVKVSVARLNTINSCDGVVVTGDARGHIKFYDRYVRLLYWCQNFNLPGVHRISFNRDPRKYRLTSKTDQTTVDTLEKKICINRKSDINDLSEQYELLYKNMVPSDATLHRAPFIVRDFIVATDDGNMVKIDYLNNDCEELLVTAEAPVAGIDVHEDLPYLVIAYRNGRVSLYDYETHNMIHSAVLPPITGEQVQPSGSSAMVVPLEEKSSDHVLTKSITYVKFSPKCYHLAVGRGNGELFFLEPVLLHAKPGYPLRKGTHSIMKLTFSMDFKYLAYYDSNRTVYLFYYDIEKDQWLMIGKHRAHTKDVTDLVFSPFNPPELYSIGADKHLVKYDIANSITDLTVSMRKKIDQTAIPNCIIFYPLLETTHFLIADDQFKFKILDPKANLYRHVFLGPAYGCYSEAPIKKISILPQSMNRYLIFATAKHIGIQKLPPDGNPYRYTGTIGHPYKIQQYTISTCGNYIFTAGRHDACVLMWKINPDAVENLEKVGGKEIHPFYCLIEGGSDGWLFQEMQNLFYYMQILHQGENTQLPRVVSDHIALTELSDLMRACGFYPTQFEIDTMLNDVEFRNKDSGQSEAEISFRDFIILYINHRPAHGISMDKLQEAFNKMCDSAGSGNDIDTEDFMKALCSKGEAFAEDSLAKCISVLMHFNQEQELDQDLASISNFPEVLTFDSFVHDILGIDMNRVGLN